MVQNGKPDPEIFLTAAKKLQIPIKKCIIIEDSLAGVEAGKQSQAFTIGITTTFLSTELTHADLVSNSFEEIDLRDLLELGLR